MPDPNSAPRHSGASAPRHSGASAPLQPGASLPFTTVASVDEGRHLAEPAQFWQESWYFDFARSDGSFGGWIRLGLYPNLGVAWYMALFAGKDRSLAAVVDVRAPIPEGAELTVALEGGAATVACEEALSRWRLSGEATGMVVADPEDMYTDAPRTETTIHHDLVWEDAGIAYPYGVTTRYEMPCRVHGTVTIGDETIAVDTFGQRDHSWGERDWWAFGWCWTAGRLDDATAFHASHIRVGGGLTFGYGQRAGAITPARSVTATETLQPNGFPTAARIEIDPGDLRLDVEPVAFAPVLLTAPDGRTARFPRALCRFVADDGRSGTGWTEWNQP